MDSYQHLRNACAKVRYAGKTFLIDPMLSAKGTYPGFEQTLRSELRNPLVELPCSVDELFQSVDAVIVSHAHLDHWDDAAQQHIPKTLPLFAQHEADATIIRGQGFTDVHVLNDTAEIDGITITRSGGKHGTDKMFAIPSLAEVLGQAMGVVFQARGHPTIYLAGDTIWEQHVDSALGSRI
jgi:L-ascorbate metabolism protein UlaG (beta-lactamase superfamily)